MSKNDIISHDNTCVYYQSSNFTWFDLRHFIAYELTLQYRYQLLSCLSLSFLERE